MKGEAGGNILFKHKALVITTRMAGRIEFISTIATELVSGSSERVEHESRIREKIGTIREYILTRLVGVLSAAGNTDDRYVSSQYDVLAWNGDHPGSPLSAFRTGQPLRYRFFFDASQMRERRDVFQRYGSDIPGLFKILARTPTLHRLFRHVESRAAADSSLREGGSVTEAAADARHSA